VGPGVGVGPPPGLGVVDGLGTGVSLGAGVSLRIGVPEARGVTLGSAHGSASRSTSVIGRDRRDAHQPAAKVLRAHTPSNATAVEQFIALRERPVRLLPGKPVHSNHPAALPAAPDPELTIPEVVGRTRL
jgi:hypothetical protein